MGNKEKSFVSAVVYLHNSEKNVQPFLSMLVEVFEKNFENSEIVLVNDNSTDKTLELIRNSDTSFEICNISVINLSYFHGLEISMNAGNDFAIGDMIFEFDSTIVDYNSDLIMEAYRTLFEGYDVVGVSPDIKESISSKLFYDTFEKLTGTRMHTERFRIISRRLLNRVNSMNKSIMYRKEAYLTSGFHTKNISYSYRKIQTPKTDKYARIQRSRLALDSLILFTELGYRLSRILTFVMMLVSLFIFIYTVVIYISSKPVEGWTTTMLFLSVAFMSVMMLFTIVIKYLQLLVDMVFKRKQYCFDNIEKLTK